jgi:hypothetical protein
LSSITFVVGSVFFSSLAFLGQPVRANRLVRAAAANSFDIDFIFRWLQDDIASVVFKMSSGPRRGHASIV